MTLKRTWVTKMTSKTSLLIFMIFYVFISNVAAYGKYDAKLNFTGLALKYGLPVMEYDVTTEDGYILKLFRVPGNNTNPVLFMHGMTDSADGAILRGHKSIVSFLSNRGYDVWVGNYRGNKYSRRHVTLNPDTDVAFWDFSMHEHGLYDLSATIDFILNNTKANRLSLIGHSEGNVIMFILGSLRPEYNDKVNIFIAWGPICYLHNIVTRIPFFFNIVKILQDVLLDLNIEEVMGYNSSLSVFGRYFCTRNPRICLNIMYLIVGYEYDGIDPEYMRKMVVYYPSGTTRKNLEHYYQVILSRRFAQYDYGVSNNLARYNSEKPPVYNLKNVSVKTALFVAENDNLATIEDVNILRKQLPNVVYYRLFKNINHIHFTVGRYAYKVIYPSVIKLLEKYV